MEDGRSVESELIPGGVGPDLTHLSESSSRPELRVEHPTTTKSPSKSFTERQKR